MCEEKFKDDMLIVEDCSIESMRYRGPGIAF